MTRRLEINWMELDAAFQSGLWEMRYFLDLETGEVVLVTDEAARYLEELLDDELPGWMQDMVELARKIEGGYGKRYIRIPKADSHEDYRDMERFTLHGSQLAPARSAMAGLERHGAFRARPSPFGPGDSSQIGLQPVATSTPSPCLLVPSTY